MSRGQYDWTCPTCKGVNFGSRATCRSNCPGVTRPGNPAASPATVKAGDWMCPCGTNNFASRDVCFKCRSPRGAVAPPPAVTSTTTGGVAVPSTAVKAGDWMCHCGTNNFASRDACFKCRGPRGASAPGGSVGTQQAPAPATGAKAGDWACAQCTFSNFGTRTHCFTCGQERPSTTTTAAGGGGKLHTTDAAILDKFALPSYWTSDPTGITAELVETQYFTSVAKTLWSKFTAYTTPRAVRRVVRCENVALWHGYCAEVQRLVAKYPSHAAPLLPKWKPKCLDMPDDFHVNETYLMHGTSPQVAEMIKENGFDPSHSGESAGAMFGQGTYFSDSLEKVMNYSKGCVVVARVALGEVAVPPHTKGTSSLRRPPSKKNGEEYDSLLGVASTNAKKEFIVYRHTKAYPEYFIYHN